MRMNYADFLEKKTRIDRPHGIEKDYALNPALFEWQAPLVRWALRRGRGCLFESPGLGKTLQSLDWARVIHEHTNKDILIAAPLAVAQQTVQEGKKFGYDVTLCRKPDQARKGLNVTNYEMLHHFDASNFIGFVGDEISCIKNETAATRNLVIGKFSQTPFRLGCTATPSPNDYMELGNQCEFLGVKTRAEMLAEYFIHDGGETSKWRLKGHAENPFWKFVASWALCLEKPSDIGYSDEGFTVPPMKEIWNVLDGGTVSDGYLFPMPAQSLMEQRQVKRGSIAQRVAFAADLINKTNEPWLIFGELNDECDLAAELIKDSIQIAGCDSIENKEERLNGFVSGKYPRLISKASICGFGMNFQHCARIFALNLSHSAEDRYQYFRRCFRFGQKREVEAHTSMMESEEPIKLNVQRKDREAASMRMAMIAHMAETMKAELGVTKRQFNEYKPDKTLELPTWIRQSSVKKPAKTGR